MHSRDHTSHLVELDGVRLLHDGDNEDTTEEIDLHRRGRFLPELCKRIPMEPAAPSPGESIEL